MKYFLMILSVTILFGCNERLSTADEKDRFQQEQLLKEGQAQTGMPSIKNFKEKKLLKMILELRDDEKLITFVYIVDLNSNLHFLGKAIGYGIPYATQYTNPLKTIEGLTRGEFTAIPQADPNGLFSPASAEGTWVLMIDPTTKDPHPVYIEPRVIISPFPLGGK